MRHVTRRDYGEVPYVRYDERPGHPMHRRRFDDATYSRILDGLVIDCVDAAIICADHPGRIWLAERATLPMQGWWIIGGRRDASAEIHDAMVINFKRETSLELPPNRFRFLRFNEYTWKDRAQEPQDGGSHNFCETFVVELSLEELAAATANLERKEYAHRKGLVAFNRIELVQLYDQDRLHPMIIDLHDQIFAA